MWDKYITSNKDFKCGDIVVLGAPHGTYNKWSLIKIIEIKYIAHSCISVSFKVLDESNPSFIGQTYYNVLMRIEKICMIDPNFAEIIDIIS